MGPAATTCWTDAAFKVAIWAALYAIPLISALSPHVDPDVWWHLRTGQTIVEEHRIPQTDPFSRYGQETGKSWLAYSWLFEASIYLAYELLGLSGIFAVRIALVLILAAAVHRFIAKREQRFGVAAALFAAAMLALGPLLTERPWLCTLVFAVLELDILLDLHAGVPTRLHWLLPLLFVLWANLHIQFVYGLLILGLACAGPVLDRLLGKSELDAALPESNKKWWSLVLVTLLCTLATLANPYHVRLFQVVFEFGTQKAQFACISELQPLACRDFRDFIVPALGGWALYSLGRRQRWKSFELLLFVAAAWFSFRTRRDIWFLTLAALVVLLSGERLFETAAGFVPTRRQAFALVSVVGVLAALGWSFELRPAHVQTTLSTDYPVESARFVRSRGYSGPLYNHFDWGGFLIWNLPELPVSMDGRSNFHGDVRLMQNYVTCNALPGWDLDPDLQDAQVIITDASRPFAGALRTDPRFALVHEDSRAVVFEARRNVTLSRIARSHSEPRP